MQHSAARVKPAVIITGGPLQKCLMMVVHIAARQNARAKPRVLTLFYTRQPGGRVGHNAHRQREIRDESIPPADERAEALLTAGYPVVPDITTDTPHDDDPALWQKRFHASADPGRPTNVHIRVDGRPNQRFALMFVDWLRANPGVQADYLAAKRAALATADYAVAKEPWFLDAYQRAWKWADTTGWQP